MEKLKSWELEGFWVKEKKKNTTGYTRKMLEV